MANVRVSQWFDHEAGYGEIVIGRKTYRYVPAPAGDLGPDEMGRVAVTEVAQDDEPTAGDGYVCRSYFDGRTSCDCPDWRYRKGPVGGRCRHLDGLVEYGILREVEPEPVGMETPW